MVAEKAKPAAMNHSPYEKEKKNAVDLIFLLVLAPLFVRLWYKAVNLKHRLMTNYSVPHYHPLYVEKCSFFWKEKYAIYAPLNMLRADVQALVTFESI